MRKSWMVMVGLALAASPLLAQEPDHPATADEQEEARPEPVFRLRVLDNPYDISSFYRSSGGSGFYGVDEGSEHHGNAYHDPYSIAGYYRSNRTGGGYGYSQFWSTGYSGR